MSEEYWAAGIIVDRPSVARLYDYMLGGYHNFACDRAAADKLLAILPDLQPAAHANRAFLRRTVCYLVEQGIDQFLDIGSGIPTVGNVHEVAQGLNAEARVVYVDIEPVAIMHSRAMLKGNPRATAIRADLRQPEEILNHPEVSALLDFRRSVGLLLVAMLHYVPDDEEAYRSVRTLREALAPGSFMVVAHLTPTVVRTPLAADLRQTYQRTGGSEASRSRPYEEIIPFFGDWTLVEPGLILTPLWRPESPSDLLVSDPERGCTLAGVAYKPPGLD